MVFSFYLMVTDILLYDEVLVTLCQFYYYYRDNTVRGIVWTEENIFCSSKNLAEPQ